MADNNFDPTDEDIAAVEIEDSNTFSIIECENCEEEYDIMGAQCIDGNPACPHCGLVSGVDLGDIFE